MRRRRRVTFAASAVTDLEAIRKWYAEQLVPDIGERLVREVVSQVERLADLPESGRVVPEFATPRLREVIHPPFRIVYRLDEGRVRIVRVWRSARLMKKLPDADA